LVFQINSTNVKVNKQIKFVQAGENVVLDIRGLIYYGGFHFTSRIITCNGDVWYHDGMTMRNTCENGGVVENFSNKKILTCRGKELLLAIYARRI
jgi:hypothetical protein